MPKKPHIPSAGAVSRPARKSLTRQEHLRKLLSRKSGATITQIQKVFGWQPHTVRAAISAQRKAGQVIVRTDGDKGAVYRIAKDVGVQ